MTPMKMKSKWNGAFVLNCDQRDCMVLNKVPFQERLTYFHDSRRKLLNSCLLFRSLVHSVERGMITRLLRVHWSVWCSAWRLLTQKTALLIFSIFVSVCLIEALSNWRPFRSQGCELRVFIFRFYSRNWVTRAIQIILHCLSCVRTK